MTHRLVLTLSDEHYALIQAVSKSAGSPSISAWACMQLVANAREALKRLDIFADEPPIDQQQEGIVTPLPAGPVEPSAGSGWGAKPTKR